MMFAIAAVVFSISCIQLVSSQCSQNCESCSDTNQCLSCKVGHWGANFGCVKNCSNNCASSSCFDNGYCYACMGGMYGPNCNQECRLCENEECRLRECTSGCKTGYFQSISGGYSDCFPCQDNCQHCQNSTFCTLCDTGYYIFRYTLTTEPKRGVASCITCQSNSVCNQCSNLSNCLQCSLSDGKVSCELCVDNSQCVENMPCSKYCLNSCTPSGFCNGCIDGKTGSFCNYTCNDRCAKCSQTDQNLCQLCKYGFYSTSCNISCPQICALGQCDFNDGSCLNGCLPGLWGDQCENNCSSHCKQFDCHRNGTCRQGCTDEYGGVYCNITMTNTKTTVLTSSSSSGIVTSNTRSESFTSVFTINNCQEGRSYLGPVVGGAVTGAVVITALLVGSIAFFLHRRSSLRTTNTELRADTMYYNTSTRTTANDETGLSSYIMPSERTVQTPETSPYEQLSATNTEHAYSGL